MNSREKEIIQSSLNDEKEVIKKLKAIYKKSLDDIDAKLAELIGREADADENTLQSIIYQKQYQQALKQQISGILDGLNAEQFTTISEYLTKSYENGFYGTMYDLHGQGIPLVFPINQEQVVQALQTDSKISEGLNKRLGEDISLLKKRISNNISRGIAQGSSYTEIAKNIAGGMIGYNPKNLGGAFARAMRITRTEGHRIQETATRNAQKKAIEKGADIIKQWDATLDSRTRDSHAKVDGELREFDKAFSNGLLFPGDPNGIAAEVVNCRCTCLQRAKWALDDEELQILKERAEYFGLDKTDNFEDFKTKYIKSIDISNKVSYNGNIKRPNIQIGKSVGAAAFRDTVLLPDGNFGKILEGSKITKVVTFAGKGTNKQIRIAPYLEKKYGVPINEWKKVRGDGYVELKDGTVSHAELHWYESYETGRVQMKVKRWFDES